MGDKIVVGIYRITFFEDLFKTEMSKKILCIGNSNDDKFNLIAYVSTLLAGKWKFEDSFNPQVVGIESLEIFSDILTAKNFEVFHFRSKSCNPQTDRATLQWLSKCLDSEIYDHVLFVFKFREPIDKPIHNQYMLNLINQVAEYLRKRSITKCILILIGDYSPERFGQLYKQFADDLKKIDYVFWVKWTKCEADELANILESEDLGNKLVIPNNDADLRFALCEIFKDVVTF